MSTPTSETSLASHPTNCSRSAPPTREALATWSEALNSSLSNLARRREGRRGPSPTSAHLSVISAFNISLRFFRKNIYGGGSPIPTRSHEDGGRDRRAQEWIHVRRRPHIGSGLPSRIVLEVFIARARTLQGDRICDQLDVQS